MNIYSFDVGPHNVTIHREDEGEEILYWWQCNSVPGFEVRESALFSADSVEAEAIQIMRSHATDKLSLLPAGKLDAVDKVAALTAAAAEAPDLFRAKALLAEACYYEEVAVAFGATGEELKSAVVDLLKRPDAETDLFDRD